MKLLGVDYGKKRVGLAISDEGQQFAFPLHVLSSVGLSPDRVAELIADIAKEKGITKVVMGESKNLKGERNTIMDDIDACTSVLLERGLEVAKEQEWFSTAQAERFQGKKEDIDSSAAAVILQAHLDTLQSQSKSTSSTHNSATSSEKYRYYDEGGSVL